MLRIFLILLAFPCYVSAEKISVIVPCYWRHVQFLEELLDAYAAQTHLPDEVVISLSEADRVDPLLLDKIEKMNLPYALNLLKTNKVLYAGENRNRAIEHARYDILVAQDADDLPHPQRLEIIHFLMEQRGVTHVIHQWFPGEEGHSTGRPPPEWVGFFKDFSSIKVRKINSSKTYAQYEYFTNGHIALRREIWEKYKWPDIKRGEDLRYNKTLIDRLKNTHLLFSPLIIYRHQYSSLDGKELR